MVFNFCGFEACVHLLCLFFQRDEPGPDSYRSVRTLTTGAVEVFSHCSLYDAHSV